MSRLIRIFEKVKVLKGKCFVPSHADPAEEIASLAQFNIEQTIIIIKAIMDILSQPTAFDDLLAELFDKFTLTMTLQQNMLIGSTIKSYLSYLVDTGQVEYFFEHNKMLWKCTDKQLVFFQEKRHCLTRFQI